MSETSKKPGWDRNFLLIWQGQMISQIGTHAFNVARVYWLAETVNRGLLVGAFLMACSLTFTLMGPIGGYYADNRSRKSIAIAADIVAGLLMVVLTLTTMQEDWDVSYRVAALFVTATGVSAATAFFNPAIMSSIPNVVPKERLKAANSMYAMASHLSQVLGQGFGGVVLNWLGAPLMFLINGISFFLSAAFESLADFKQPRRSPVVKDGRPRSFLARFRHDFSEGIAALRGTSGMAGIVKYLAADAFLLMPIFVLTPYLVKDVYLSDSDVYGYFIGAFSAGMVAGYALVPFLSRSHRRRAHLFFLQASFGLRCAAMVWIGLCRDIGLGVCGFFILGLASAYSSNDVFTSIQKSVTNELLGRVLGLVNTLENLSVPISFLLSGLLVDVARHHIPAIYIVGGCLSFVAILRFIVFDGEVRRILFGSSS